MQPKNKLALDWCFCTKTEAKINVLAVETSMLKFQNVGINVRIICVCVCVCRNKVQEREWEEVVGC